MEGQGAGGRWALAVRMVHCRAGGSSRESHPAWWELED